MKFDSKRYNWLFHGTWNIRNLLAHIQNDVPYNFHSNKSHVNALRHSSVKGLYAFQKLSLSFIKCLMTLILPLSRSENLINVSKTHFDNYKKNSFPLSSTIDLVTLLSWCPFPLHTSPYSPYVSSTAIFDELYCFKIRLTQFDHKQTMYSRNK
jgi:hypothetical protein